MRIRFCAVGCINAWCEEGIKFLNGQDAEVPEEKARKLLRRFPQYFKLAEVQNNKQMQGSQNKCL